jgi:hypothetical protein
MYVDGWQIGGGSLQGFLTDGHMYADTAFLLTDHSANSTHDGLLAWPRCSGKYLIIRMIPFNDSG